MYKNLSSAKSFNVSINFFWYINDVKFFIFIKDNLFNPISFDNSENIIENLSKFP
jgi:hypothetical protein